METRSIIQTAIISKPKSASLHLDFLFNTVYDGMLESISRMIEKSSCKNAMKLEAQNIQLNIFQSTRSDIKQFQSLPLEEKLDFFNIAHLLQIKDSFITAESTISGLIETSKFMISLNEQARLGKLSVSSNLKEYIALTDKCRDEFKSKYNTELNAIISIVYDVNQPTMEEVKMNDEQFYKDAEEKLRASGNHKSPAKKHSELSKGVKRFVDRKLNEETNKGS